MISMRVASIVGARPNFIKLAPVHRAISDICDHTIIHTGQHYDYELSEIFFKEFNLPKPDFNLEVGSATPGLQISEMIKRIEEILLKSKFDLVLVYGDTNSTFAGALSASRIGVPVAHVESGLRSFDKRMPEETNRIMTDQLSDYLFASTLTAVDNLKKENICSNIIYSGDISVEIIKQASEFALNSTILQNMDVGSKSYILLTMHRAENTSSNDILTSLINAIRSVEQTIIFPMHPRTANILKEKNLYGLLEERKNLKIIPPVGYIDFVSLMRNAEKIITDSGGVQKEAYLLSVPCITIRDNTEWVETVQEGWNILVGSDVERIVEAAKKWLPLAKNTRPIFGKGQTSHIIKETIRSLAHSS